MSLHYALLCGEIWFSFYTTLRKRGTSYDVVVIGGGVIGCSIARELSRYALRVCVVEKEADGCGTSKANSDYPCRLRRRARKFKGQIEC